MYGWVRVVWRKPARRCVGCGRKARVGTVDVNMVGRHREPGFRFLCDWCVGRLDEGIPIGG